MSKENRQQEPDFLSMSDEDILNYNTNLLDEPDTDEDDVQDPPAGEAEGAESGAAATEGDGDEGEEENTDTADTDADDDEPAGSTGSDDDDGEDGAPAAAATADGDDAGDTSDDADPGEGEPAPEKDPEGGKDDKQADEAKAEKDKPDEAKTFYEKVTAPFRANGKDMQITDPDDAIRLMQMGANYNKKMAGLKPGLKVLKLLENNELMDEGKIGFLIDLNKRDPAAIAKLVKDSGIDPLDLDTDENKGYKPKDYSVDDREIELDDVIGEIKDSDTYSKTIDLVSNRWDDNSKQAIANSPQLLKVIDDHMASGVYELISKEMDRERTLGRLNGISDIEAYRRVGDTINARGGFDHLFPEATPAPAPQQKTVTPASKPTDPKLNEKRRAAGPPKKSAPKQAAQEFNPLSLSDEEFAKQAQAHLM